MDSLLSELRKFETFHAQGYFYIKKIRGSKNVLIQASYEPFKYVRNDIIDLLLFWSFGVKMNWNPMKGSGDLKGIFYEYPIELIDYADMVNKEINETFTAEEVYTQIKHLIKTIVA